MISFYFYLGAIVMEDIKAKIINRQMLTETVMELTIETFEEVHIVPGQRALFAFTDAEWTFQRSYSVLDQDTDNNKTMLIFAIKLLDHGRWSAVLKSLHIGDILTLRGIFGQFTLKNTPAPKVFVGTWVWLIPVLNMAKYCTTSKHLFFSVSYHKDLFYEERIKKIRNLIAHIHLSRENIPGYTAGRIDLSSYHFPLDTEFYLCGKPETIHDVIEKLKNLGYQNIYFENF